MPRRSFAVPTVLALAVGIAGCTYPATVYAPPPALTPRLSQMGDVHVAGRWSPVGATRDDRERTESREDARLSDAPIGNWSGEVAASPAPHFALFAAGSHADNYEHRHTAYDLGVGTYVRLPSGALLEAYAGWGRGEFTGIGREGTGDVGTSPFRVGGTYDRAFGQVNLSADLGGAEAGGAVRVSRVAYDGTYHGLRDPAGVATDLDLVYLEPHVFVLLDFGLPVGFEGAFGWVERMNGPPEVDLGERGATFSAGVRVDVDEAWRLVR